ncbi:MAG: hypothetical protein KGL35_08085 [Bradyrhizobium sp.]|nr:hypothetical protein [Bradyrhizobium sp.]
MDEIKREALSLAVQMNQGRPHTDTVLAAKAFDEFLRTPDRPSVAPRSIAEIAQRARDLGILEESRPCPSVADLDARDALASRKGFESAQPYDHGLPRPKRLAEEEARCAEGRTAPRVSLADIEQEIGRVYWITGEQAVHLATAGQSYRRHVVTPHTACDPLSVLTLCLIVMCNGFVVIGKSAPASPENFNEVLGCDLAYEDAVRQIWPLAGYALRCDLVRSAGAKAQP